MALQAIGLGPEHERLYLRMLADPAGVTTAPGQGTELADLQRVGLLQPDRDAPGRLRAQPPMILEELVERMTRELAEKQRDIAQARVDVAGLVLAYRSRLGGAEGGGEENDIEYLSEVDTVRERLDELSFFARHSVFAVQPTTRDEGARVAAHRVDQRCLRRGLDIRVVVDRPVRVDVAQGVQVRVRPGPMQRLVMIDRAVAVIALDTSGVGGAIVVRQPALLQALVGSFDLLWASAGGGQPGPEPSAADRELIEVLCCGDTDEVVARRLGVSSRHLRRRVTRLMEVLDSRSRFAAGVMAARRGWI